ncbi:TrbM/KikA/MpfK family conjugal transfer protein [Neisseria iguanae]|uniref:Conjugal transfer protein TrbM n=1 Tax=Neisseria iguanae TaxID=90242 RepID=A0A2P7TWV4_9NEIS|nr:TrbM/KikA/MpfK family conjugal transfer protein [Neisseria iguanae]PSJ79212.1 conjugal transfer protein TrbM [Neisseria iguanae]
MKKSLLAVAVMVAAVPAAYAGDLLTGDVRLACEVVLCLSSGDRPGECAPSIKRYFSIKHKKLSDTVKGRLNFLNLCPASKEENMPQLVNAIANGAGRCDAAELNRVMRATYTTQKCYYRSQKAGGRYCTDTKVTYVRNAYPSYCKAYFDHGWTTAADSVRYAGEEKNGGKWVDVQ